MAKKSQYLGSVSDLMAGLAIVFLFIAISYMVEVKAKEDQEQTDKEKLLEQKESLAKANQFLANANERIREVATTYDMLQNELQSALREEFEDDLPRWGATLEKDNSIRFNEPNVLFSTGNANVSERFKDILDDFFPRYLAIIYDERFLDNEKTSQIEEIRIEGHTSSSWKGADSANEVYLKNASLSQDRAHEVLAYCFSKNQNYSYRENLIRDIRSNGLSYARTIINPATGKEDEEASQRVEFRVITKTKEKILRILEETPNESEKTEEEND